MQAKYKYILLSNDTGERLVLHDAPEGWDATKFRLIRDLTYLGILKNISVEFEFVGDGFLFLQHQRLVYGIDADVIIRVYKTNPNEFLYEGKVNMENFAEDRKFRKFKVDIIQSSFVQDFQNREDVKLNLMNTISMDRHPVASSAVKQSLFRGKSIQFYSEFAGVSATPEPHIYHHTLPFLIKVNGSPNVYKDGFYGDDFDGWVPPGEQSELINMQYAVYINNYPDPQTPHIKGDASMTFVFKASGTTFRNENRIRFYLVNEDNTIAATLYAKDLLIKSNPQDSSVTYSINWDITPTVAPNQFIVFVLERWRWNGEDDIMEPANQVFMENTSFLGNRTETYYNSLNMTITDDSIIDDTSHPVILPHELFSNLVAQMTEGSFYSDFFGRTELGYAVDGPGAFLAITKGELLRGIPLAEVQVATSFRDAFKSYSSVFCLGAMILDDVIRIEPLDILFNSELTAHIGEVNELVVMPAKEYLFNSVKSGYPKNEYEEENGRDEFNTTYQFTNSLRAVKKELDIVSIFMGDGYGIEFARRQSVLTTGTKDSKYDDQIFLIDLIKIEPEEEGEPYTLQTRRLEGILHVDGIFSPETAMNLRIAAGQNMLRWAKFLNIPLHRKNKTYFFQSKDKNASLELVTALGTTIDGQDLQTGSQFYFLPEQRTFKCPITVEQLAAILQAPLGIISFTYQGEKFFDFAFEIDAETDKGQATWRTLGTKETPVQVEEDVDGANQNVLKYADGLTDYVKYGPGENDVLLYQ